MSFRYRLKIYATVEEQFLSITLFDGAEYVFDCDVQEYVQSTSKKVSHLLQYEN